MKKSNIFLLLVIQIASLFIFSNIYTLFKPLEIKEIEAFKESVDLTAELYLLKYKTDLQRMEEAGFFDRIDREVGAKRAKYTLESEKKRLYVVKLPQAGNRTLVFRKEIDSLPLTLLKKLKKTFSTLSITLGIFLIFTGLYLIFLSRKDRGGIDMKGLPPLQDYLVKLKGSELQLKNLVQQQQESVTRQDELNKSIINNINAAIIFLNPAGRTDIFNKVAEELFSQGYAHAKNNEVRKILVGFPEITRFIEDNAEKTINVSAEIESEGQDRVYLIDLIPVENAGKLIIIKDISEEKQQEKRESSNKNFIMLGEMAAFLAHEIRNSLGVIYGYTRTITPGKGEKKDDKLSQKVDKVNKEINFLSAMMESFLSFSKPIKVDKAEKIDLNILLKKIAAEAGITIEIAAAGIFIDNDRTLIKSVFSNLMLNSKEAGADTVKIEVKKKYKGRRLEILLKDNGSGIDEKIKTKIWYPFFTTKKKGTGMGLAIIKKIINSLDGDIALVDSASTGAAFKITFFPPARGAD
ncbi:MAG: hypothetical protein KAW12_08950 [Candidatus Aminicenantes bacterium]|nr:hypothetical protein [Candidatus Aminicenantes bacterium]